MRLRMVRADHPTEARGLESRRSRSLITPFIDAENHLRRRGDAHAPEEVYLTGAGGKFIFFRRAWKRGSERRGSWGQLGFARNPRAVRAFAGITAGS